MWTSRRAPKDLTCDACGSTIKWREWAFYRYEDINQKRPSARTCIKCYGWTGTEPYNKRPPTPQEV